MLLLNRQLDAMRAQIGPVSRRADTRSRPSPEALLREAAQEGRGRLKVFLGAAPGVGKTYEMLTEGAARRSAGVDVVIGVVETHGRAETEALIGDLEIVPRQRDRLSGPRAHRDGHRRDPRAPPGSWCWSTSSPTPTRPAAATPSAIRTSRSCSRPASTSIRRVNIQHLESLNDVVASFTKVRVRETVPDRVLENAEIEVVDIPPDELIERLKEGKVYVPHEATRALGHFFSKSNLSALRELALRRAAQAVDAQMLDYLRAHALAGTWAAGERVVVAVSELPGSTGLVRAAKRLADALRAPWTARPYRNAARARASASEERSSWPPRCSSPPARRATSRIGAGDIGDRRAQGASRPRRRATQLVVGKSARSRWFELRHGSVVDRLVRETPGRRRPCPAVRTSRRAEPQPRRRRSAGRLGRPLGYVVLAGAGRGGHRARRRRLLVRQSHQCRPCSI